MRMNTDKSIWSLKSDRPLFWKRPFNYDLINDKLTYFLTQHANEQVVDRKRPQTAYRTTKRSKRYYKTYYKS